MSRRFGGHADNGDSTIDVLCNDRTRTDTGFVADSCSREQDGAGSYLAGVSHLDVSKQTCLWGYFSELAYSYIVTYESSAMNKTTVSDPISAFNHCIR